MITTITRDICRKHSDETIQKMKDKRRTFTTTNKKFSFAGKDYKSLRALWRAAREMGFCNVTYLCFWKRVEVSRWEIGTALRTENRRHNGRAAI